MYVVTKDFYNSVMLSLGQRLLTMITRILIIGDSQVESALKTYGFGSILNDRFNGDADVILR